MKKIVAILALLSIILTLAACQKQVSPAPEAETDTAITAGAEPEAAPAVICVFELSINPRFRIHVVDGMVIGHIEYLNPEAEADFADVQATGGAVFDGIYLLLERACEKGYADNGTEVAVRFITATGEELLQFTQDELRIAVDNMAQQGVNLALTCSSDDVTIIPFAEPVSAPQIDDESYELVERDKDGRVIKTVTKDAEGSDIITVYEYDKSGNFLTETITQVTPDGDKLTVVKDAHGNLLQNEAETTPPEDNSGLEEEIFESVEKDEQGRITKSVQRNSAGYPITVYYTYDENGRIAKESISQYDSIGNPVAWDQYNYYNSDGSISSRYRLYSNGSTTETSYSGGVPTVMVSHDATNGYVQTITYNPNGTVSSSITDMPDGKYERWYYDANGVLLERYGFTLAGEPIHTVYNPDGSGVSTITLPDGTTYTENTNP